MNWTLIEVGEIMFPNLGTGLFSFMVLEKQTQHKIEYLIRHIKTQVEYEYCK